MAATAILELDLIESGILQAMETETVFTIWLGFLTKVGGQYPPLSKVRGRSPFLICRSA